MQIGLDFDLLRHKLHMDMKRLVGNPLLVLGGGLVRIQLLLI